MDIKLRDYLETQYAKYKRKKLHFQSLNVRTQDATKITYELEQIHLLLSMVLEQSLVSATNKTVLLDMPEVKGGIVQVTVNKKKRKRNAENKNK